MTPRTFPLSPIARACAAVAVAGAAAGYGTAAHAATAAGTEIKNLATVTYEDAAGNVFSAQSNEAIVTVAQIFSATVGTDIDVDGAPGQTVNLPYVLTNTGNGTDDFFVSAADDASIAGDSIDATDITVYRDTNGNGQPDAGEPAIAATDAISLTGGESANLVVSVRVPTTATSGQGLGITLTAQAANGTGAAVAGSVTDLTTGGGRDSADGTNQSLISITNDAVLVTTKTSSHDVANNQITYTISVSNTGATAAENVILFDGLPEGTTFVSSSESGILPSNGDVVTGGTSESNITESGTLDFNGDGTVTGAGEPGIGLDLNTDGDTADTTVEGVYAVDAALAPNATVSMTFTVAYDPVTYGGGNTIDNVGYVSADTDGDGANDTLFTSNRTSDEVTQAFSLTLSDTGADGAAGVNDGGDDDNAVDGVQTVDSAASGGTVNFNVTVTNTGNGEDTFEITSQIGTFPTGTVFTFVDQATGVALTDTNGVGGVDSGPLAQNESRTFVVRAKLPQGASGDNAGAGYQATVTATSSADPTASTSDTVTLSLLDIASASSDIHAGATAGTIGADESPLGAAPYTVAETLVANAGDDVTFSLGIDNEGGTSDSFQLFAGSTFDGANLGTLPAGWSVQFFLEDPNNAGSPGGAAITTTPSIPGGTVDFRVFAVVSVPADATLAEANYLTSDRDADGTPDPFDANSDGDSDYPVFFQIVSASSGATDAMLNAVDVEASRQVTFSPSASNQVEPGGTVDYPLTVSNTGNSQETLELEATNSQAGQGFANTVSIDTDGDGVPDTELGNLVAVATANGGTITVQLADGSTAVIAVVDVDGDGNPELVLDPGIVVPLRATVLAPSSAPPGQVDTLTITATNNDGTGPSNSVSFQTDVINGQVRLTKTAAVDTDCTGTADVVADADFAAVQNVQVEPEQCIVWRVQAENQGAVNAENVQVTDAAPAFTSYVPGTLGYRLCDNPTSCDPNLMTDTDTDTDAGVQLGAGAPIQFFIGTGSDGNAGQGGTLVPGQRAVVQFMVQVE